MRNRPGGLATGGIVAHPLGMNSSNELPDSSMLPRLRTRIDALDARLVALLAERSRLIDEAARIKARENLPARIDSRVEEVAHNARRLAEEEGLHPDLAERIWRLMVEHFIAQEEIYLQESGEDGA